jgi:hypothetical protein
VIACLRRDTWAASAAQAADAARRLVTSTQPRNWVRPSEFRGYGLIMLKKVTGRPRGSYAVFETDRDAPAVVLLDTQMRFASLRHGVDVNERHAAVWAVFACLAMKYPYKGPTHKEGPPPRRLAATGHRHSPTKKSFLGGYAEFELEVNGRYFAAAADRVRKKRLAWRRRADARKWLSIRSYGLAQYLYRGGISQNDLYWRHRETE